MYVPDSNFFRGFRRDQALGITFIEDIQMIIDYRNGRKIIIPLANIRVLKFCSPELREDWEIIGMRYAVRWRALEEEIPLAECELIGRYGGFVYREHDDKFPENKDIVSTLTDLPMGSKGYTTRLVDRAIQLVFAGNVCLVEDHFEGGKNWPANEQLMKRIEKRLFYEHPETKFCIEHYGRAYTIKITG